MAAQITERDIAQDSVKETAIKYSKKALPHSKP